LEITVKSNSLYKWVLTSVACATLALLSACGRPAKHAASLDVAGFESYVTAFEAAAAQQGALLHVVDLTIRFGQVDADGETGGRGVCESAAGETPVITISQAAWNASSDAEKEELVFHEMGHCVLHKTHEAGINSDGIPASLMNPTKIDGSIYSQFKAYYLAKLFVK
jgi:hypothetical protein